MKTRTERSAGGVVIRTTGTEPEVVLASRRTRRGELAWGLAKGLVEKGEMAEEGAMREVREETGLQVKILAPLGEISYWFVWEGERIHKRVTFFLMEAIGGDLSQHDREMEDVKWFPLSDALRLASYRSEKDVLRRAAEALHVPL